MKGEELRSIGGITPSLTVNDLTKSIDFYTNGLGFTLVDSHKSGDKIAWVSLRAGDGILELTQDDFAKGTSRQKGVAVRLWIETTQDLQAIADQAKQAGIKLDVEVQPLPWGPVGFALTDPDGFKWTIFNPMPSPAGR